MNDNMIKNKIIEDIISRDEKLEIYEIVEEALKYYVEVLPFKEPDPNNMLEEAEEDYIPRDTRLFSQYIGGIENSTAPLLNYYEGDEFALKFLRNDKEGTIGVTYFDYSHGKYDEFSNCITSTVVLPISSEKRLHIGVMKDFSGINIIDYNDKVDEYDSKYGEEYQGYFSDKLEKIKNIKDFDRKSIKYTFTESEMLWFKELIEKYNIYSSIVMINGYLVLDLFVKLQTTYEANVEKVVDFLEFINQIIERFENV